MNWQEWAIAAVIIGTIISGVLLLKQSAKKFKLSDEQLKRINERNRALEKEEQKEDESS